MELLIPGLALVALMVYVSTKLKKAAAEALEPEDVETDEFSIAKPAGFINVASPDDGLLFRAYTKEFADTAPNFRKADATIRVAENSSIARVSDALKESGEVISYKPETNGSDSPQIIRIDVAGNGGTLHRSVKLIQKEDRVFMLQFDTPEGCEDEFLVARRQMNDSFELKY